jgi:hypothetical protein
MVGIARLLCPVQSAVVRTRSVVMKEYSAMDEFKVGLKKAGATAAAGTSFLSPSAR